ncbi:hypothetical protein VCR14J2_610436 [Vibrio coralliirubri]|nr:hypothetical protein VCR14J2_610436 [Vibrio coralliirubri]
MSISEQYQSDDGEFNVSFSSSDFDWSRTGSLRPMGQKQT